MSSSLISIVTDALMGALLIIAVLLLTLAQAPRFADERVWTPRDLALCNSICETYRKSPTSGLIEKEPTDDY